MPLPCGHAGLGGDTQPLAELQQSLMAHPHSRQLPPAFESFFSFSSSFQPHQNNARIFLLCHFNVWTSQFGFNLYYSSFLYRARFELFAPFQFSGAEALFFSPGLAQSCCFKKGKAKSTYKLLRWDLCIERARPPLGSWSIYTGGQWQQNIPKINADKGLKRMIIAEGREKKGKVLLLCDFNVRTFQFVFNLYYSSFCLCWARFELFTLFQFC